MIRGRDDSSLSILLGIHGGFAQEAKKLMDGEWRHGTWATYAKFPLESLIPLPEPRLCKELGYQIKELTTIGMLAVLYGGLAEIGVGAGETLIVAPATGFYGAAAVGVALALGCTAVAAGRNMGQLRKLEEIFGGTQRFKTFVLMGDVGIDTESLKKSWGLGRGADAYIDFSPPAAAGSTHITSCLGALRQGGKAVLMGGILGNIELPYSMIMFRGLRIQGQFMFERRHVERLVRLVDSSALKLGREIGMVSFKEFELEECGQVCGGRESVGQSSTFMSLKCNALSLPNSYYGPSFQGTDLKNLLMLNEWSSINIV